MHEGILLDLTLVAALAGCSSAAVDRPATEAAVGYAQPPATSHVVNAIQIDLTRLGYYAGPIDGRLGPRTARATLHLADHLWNVGRLPARGRPADSGASTAGQG